MYQNVWNLFDWYSHREHSASLEWLYDSDLELYV